MKKYMGLLYCLSLISCGDETEKALRQSMQPMADSVQLSIEGSRFIPNDKQQILAVSANIKNHGSTPVMLSFTSFHLETADGITVSADGLETARLDNNCNVVIQLAPNASFSCQVAFTAQRITPRKLIFTNLPGMYDAPVAYFGQSDVAGYNSNYYG